MEKIFGELPPSHVEAEELEHYIGRTVLVHGRIYKIREMSGFAFILLQMKTSLLQCLYLPEAAAFPLGSLKENMSVLFRGLAVREPRAKTGVEVRITDAEILSEPAEAPPFAINGKEVAATLETLLNYRPLTLRNAKERAVFKLQAGICVGFRRFLEENDFVEIHSPKLVYSGAEGGANEFRLDYFGREARLAQSPQFYKQIMMGVFERVYEIAPVFRAEKHDTSRHLNEYTSVDLEMGFLTDFRQLMRLETQMILYSLDFLREHCGEELALAKAELPAFTEIPAIPFDSAKELVSRTYHREITDFADFEPEEEKLLCEIIKKEEGSDFVFVTHYRSEKRPFYTMDCEDNAELTNSFDLLFRGMEVTTGGQRIHSYEAQVRKLRERGMEPEAFASYLMAHKYGLPPHGGLGLGLERFTAKLLGFQNVRQATLFPRDTHRLEP